MEASRDTTASLDPTKIQKILESEPLPSVHPWPRALPAVPFLLVCITEFGSPWSFTPFTLLLANIRGTALLPPVPLMWNNWSRDCFFLCPWCSIPSESCHFTCAPPGFCLGSVNNHKCHLAGIIAAKHAKDGRHSQRHSWKPVGSKCSGDVSRKPEWSQHLWPELCGDGRIVTQSPSHQLVLLLHCLSAPVTPPCSPLIW